MGKYDKAADKAAELTDEELAKGLEKIANYPEGEFEKMFPEGDPQKLKELLEVVRASTTKNEKIAKVKNLAVKHGKVILEMAKRAAEIVALICLLLIPKMLHAEAIPVRMWNDLKANSSVNLGTNIAVGSFHDFVYGDTMLGGKSSIYSYRFMHLEIGMAKRPDKRGPIIFTVGTAAYLQPLLKIALIPDKWVLIKQLYVGPFAGYDFHIWRAGMQAHFAFDLPIVSGKSFKK